MSQEKVPPRLIKSNIDQLTKLVKRPVVNEKVLSRPPFRFLFDLITGIIKSSGYLRGLYTEEEFVFDNANSSRETKMAFLDKLIEAIGLINQKAMDVKSSKIVAGVEVEKTNRLLAEFAICVHEKKPFLEVVDKLRKGVKLFQSSQGSAKSSQLTSKDQSKNSNQANKGGKTNTASKVSTKSKNTASSRVDTKSTVKEETSKKIDVSEKVMQATEEEKPSRPSTTTRTELHSSPPTESTFESQINDRHDRVEGNYEQDEDANVMAESILVSQDNLAKDSVAVPLLDDHTIDHITNESLIEISSSSRSFAKVSDQDQEPKNQGELADITNTVLESFDSVNEDSVKVSQKYYGSERVKDPDNPEEVPKNNELLEDDSRSKSLRTHSRSSRASSKRSSTRSNLSVVSASKDHSSQLSDKHIYSEKNEFNNSSTFMNDNSDLMNDIIKTNALEPSETLTEINTENSEPKTRPQIMTEATSAKEVPLVPRARSTRPVEGALSRLQSSIPDEVPRRPMSRLKSTRPTSSRPAPPRVMTASRSRLSHLMQQRMDQFGEAQATPTSTWVPPEKNDDDDDFVMSSQKLHQTLLTTSDEVVNNDDLTVSDSEKGRLVQQLLATKLELEGKVRSDDSTRGKKDSEISANDGEQLRNNVQHLCQSINILSKALNYLHEDIDPMMMELQRWNEEFRANIIIISRMKSETQKELEPLKKELEMLEHEMESYEEIVRGTRATVVRNQTLIAKMIESV